MAVSFARGALTALLLAGALVGCTTVMSPVECGRHRFQCGALSDVKYCESVATTVEGPDCASVGIAPSKAFCFVTRGQCAETTYALSDRSCRIVKYEALREWSVCTPGTPTFAGP